MASASGAGIQVLALALGWPRALPWALVVLGGAYLATLVAAGRSVGSEAPVVGAGLLAASELGAWSLDARAGRAERGVSAARAARLGGLLMVAGTLAALPLLVSSVRVDAGSLPVFLAAAAVVALLAVIAVLAWQVLAPDEAGTLKNRR